jgi:uncharacterized membrane protein
METQEQPLPTHVDEALQAIANMQLAHHEQASPLDRMVDHVTATVARPRFLIYLGGAAMLWIGANILLGRGAPDAPPFPLLELVASCAALVISVLILASQRRADILANLRQQMTLEVALLTTQKTSKLVELIEEFRRDSPNVKDRIDTVALEMAEAPDHGTVLLAVQQVTNAKGAEIRPGFAD